ncbi:tetratricopeptide repeat protein, partial [bacterium]|nr:tetratricopeptide repeat protein [bacterium]
YDKALADIDRALEIEPENAALLVNRANIFADRKQMERALADYDRALALRPGSVEILNNRGAIRTEAGDHAGALADFAAVIEIDPANSQAYNNRAVLYCDQRRYDLAIADYHRALEAGPGDIFAYLNIAELFIVLDRHQEALITLQKAPTVDYDANNRAICHYLTCVAKRMLDLDVREDERRLSDLLPKVFNVGWSFTEVENWLATADIDPGHRSYIIGLTERLKGKTVGQ